MQPGPSFCAWALVRLCFVLGRLSHAAVGIKLGNNAAAEAFSNCIDAVCPAAQGSLHNFRKLCSLLHPSDCMMRPSSSERGCSPCCSDCTLSLP